MPAATLDLTSAAAQEWDAIVVGAGPAGSLAAREIARRGSQVLLVDRTHFPRHKVCGACLNPRGLAILSKVGLPDLADRLGAVALRDLRLYAWGHRASLPLPGSKVLSRESLDSTLIDAAISSGAHFLPDTLARLESVDANARWLQLKQVGKEVRISAKVVLAADGLAGTLRSVMRTLRPVPSSGSRLGVGGVVDTGPSDYDAGTIYMACGDAGYAGLVRLQDGRLNIAAAIDPEAVKRRGEPGKVVASILHQANQVPIPELETTRWYGTPLLTQRPSRIAGQRVFLIGDAAGYVEPFTGEGISWALASAVAVAPLAERGVWGWHDDLAHEWSLLHGHVVENRQWACRAMAFVLRRRTLASLLTTALAWLPALSGPILRYMSKASA